MTDFIKIFLSICALVCAFVFGRNYGEKSFRESEEYKNFVKTNEETNFKKVEVENLKVKLQNIVDTADTKKTDELLSQIFEVFLADLGIQVQNREALLKQSKCEPIVVTAPAVPATPPPAIEQKHEQPKVAAEGWSQAKSNRFKSFEWMVLNSDGSPSLIKDLKKLEIKNMPEFLKQSTPAVQSECSQLAGVYKGSVKDINNKHFGSLNFELKSAEINTQEQIYGEISWNNNGNSVTEKFKNTCGRKVKGLNGRIFNLTADRYVQLYKLNTLEKVAGNFYEVLPNGSTKLIGSFALSRF